jgi:hypothetical protein
MTADAIRLQAPAGDPYRARERRPDFTAGHVIPYRAGFYCAQLKKRAVMVGIHIWHGWGKQDGRDVEIIWDAAGNIVLKWAEPIERVWGWHACRDNVAIHPWSVWPECSGSEIDEVDYLRLLSRRRHATDFAPDSPFASPHQAVDWSTVKHSLPDRRNQQQ